MMTTSPISSVEPDPVFTTHLHEYLVSLRPTGPHWYPNRGRDLDIVQLNITFRYDPDAAARLGGSRGNPWVFDRAIAYADDANGFTHQIRWTAKSKPERIPRWLPALIATHTPAVTG